MSTRHDQPAVIAGQLDIYDELNEQEKAMDLTPQIRLATDVEALAQELARSTRTVERPSESYRLLGELHAVTDHLAQVCAQLSQWHGDTVEGQTRLGEDTSGDRAEAESAAAQLRAAEHHLREATQAVMSAQGANGAIRWLDVPSEKAP